MRVVVADHERGVLSAAGAPPRLLGPGRHRFWRRGCRVRVVDLRPSLLRVSGQEVLTADGVGVRLSVVLRYRILDPLAWMASAADDDTGAPRLYLAAQLAVRDVVGATAAADLPALRGEATAALAEAVAAVAAEVGAQLLEVAVRDLTLPGDLKRVFAQVAAARQEALAALERARGETATLRSLANAAKLLDANPSLARLRALAALERGGGSLVLHTEEQRPQ
ncbi:MAG: SPFH domain-containing protein [Kineosporiaceae bacterium]